MEVLSSFTSPNTAINLRYWVRRHVLHLFTVSPRWSWAKTSVVTDPPTFCYWKDAVHLIRRLFFFSSLLVKFAIRIGLEVDEQFVFSSQFGNRWCLSLSSCHCFYHSVSSVSVTPRKVLQEGDFLNLLCWRIVDYFVHFFLFMRSVTDLNSNFEMSSVPCSSLCARTPKERNCRWCTRLSCDRSSILSSSRSSDRIRCFFLRIPSEKLLKVIIQSQWTTLVFRFPLRRSPLCSQTAVTSVVWTSKFRGDGNSVFVVWY